MRFRLGNIGVTQRCTQCTRYRTDVLEQVQSEGRPCDDTECSFKAEIEYLLQGNYPVIKYFKVIPEFVKEEEVVVLEWEVENVDSVELSHGIGLVPLEAKSIEFVAPGGDLEIELTASNKFEVSSKVSLKPYPVNILAFKVNKDVSLPDQDVQLTWETDGAKTLTINDNVEVTHSDNYNFKVGEYDEFIELMAYGHFGVNTLEKHVEIRIATVDFFDHVEVNDNHALEWETSNIVRIEIEKNGQLLSRYQGQICKKGAKQIFPSNEDVIYTLKAYTVYDDCTTETIELKAAVVEYFSANETLVYDSMPVRLEWATQNAEEVILEPLGISLPLNGSERMEISDKLLTYELVVKGRINTVRRKVQFRWVQVSTISDVKISIPNILMTSTIEWRLKRSNSLNIPIVKVDNNILIEKLKQNYAQIPKIKYAHLTKLSNFFRKKEIDAQELEKINHINVPSQTNVRSLVNVAEIEKNLKH